MSETPMNKLHSWLRQPSSDGPFLRASWRLFLWYWKIILLVLPFAIIYAMIRIWLHGGVQ